MPVKLSRWGNSLGLRISRDIIERAALKPGDLMFIRLTDSGDIIVRPFKAREIPEGYQVPGTEVPSSTPCSVQPKKANPTW
jgi:antitoxin component of MazEF toxin-antitoxin module